MKWYNGVTLLAFYVFYIWVLGGMVFSALEGGSHAGCQDVEHRMFVDFTEQCGEWNLYNASFFAFTAITTIGYGRTAPKTQEGRGYCIIYCLLGVPFNTIVVVKIAIFFKNIFVKTTEAVQKASLILEFL